MALMHCIAFSLTCRCFRHEQQCLQLSSGVSELEFIRESFKYYQHAYECPAMQGALSNTAQGQHLLVMHTLPHP